MPDRSGGSPSPRPLGHATTDLAVDPSAHEGAPAPTHFPGFESLRALAALMVVVHHAASVAGPGRSEPLTTLAAVGDSGVTIFFVLSGFLIFRPFVAATIAGRPRPRWVPFWWRRLLRIVPAYWLALSVLWAIGNFSLGDDWWRYYLFLQIYDQLTVFGGLVVAWSLATEVSFYLALPFVALALELLGRRLSPTGRLRLHLAACAVGVAGAVAARWFVDTHAESQRGIAFNWLPMNADSFSIGMALAVLSVWATLDEPLHRRLARSARLVWPFWLGAAAIFVLYAYRVGVVSFEEGYTGWFWQRRQLTLSVLGALLMFPAVFGDQRHGLIRRVWSWSPVAWVGTVSYGLYLWHQEWMERAVTTAARTGWRDVPLGDASFAYVLVAGLGAGLLCAAASWYGLERPLSRFKKLLDRPSPPSGSGGSPTTRPEGQLV